MSGRTARGLAAFLTALASLAAPAGAEPIELSRAGRGRITLVVRQAPVVEVFEMLARKEQVNIVLGDEVEGEVSVNLFEVTLDRAVRAIADAAGYVAEGRRGNYRIVPREEAGRDFADNNTAIRSFKIEYSDPEQIQSIVEKHLSRYGEATVLPERRLLVVEDRADFLGRIERLLAEIDRAPHQILIQARILEIKLEEEERFGIDWTAFFKNGSVGVRDFVTGGAGFFFDFLNKDIEVEITALTEKGRVRALAAPVLLTLENEESEVVIGDRLGFSVTTTINQVTTQSVEFLESGVILRFIASVDRARRIVLAIHPEVSSGTLSDDGIPSQTTTEVTTKLALDSGQSIFIAGLIRESETDDREGVPYLMDVPLLGRAFSKTLTRDLNTETVVILTARIVGDETRELNARTTQEVFQAEAELRREKRARERRIVPVDPLTQTLPGPPWMWLEYEAGRAQRAPEPEPAAPAEAAPAAPAP